MFLAIVGCIDADICSDKPDPLGTPRWVEDVREFCVSTVVSEAYVAMEGCWKEFEDGIII